MRKILLLCFAVFGLVLSQSVMAQPKTVTGVVVDASTGEALPGVNVIIKGTVRGVSTDVNGRYSVSVSPGEILVFKFIGYTDQEITIGAANTVNVQLQSDIQAIGEVVVTALGIKEERKNLGISVSEVKGDAVTQSQRTNFVDALQGRVAGVVINQTSGLPGASSQVVIRGVTSLSGSNEPLYVVDGLPYNNRTFATSSLASATSTTASLENRNVDFTNRAADLNPDDIESITILKGPEATSLYGVDASHGAIIITTKRGKAGKMSVNYSSSFSVVKINKYPEIQRVYGQGSNGIANNTVFSYFGEPYASDSVLYDNIKPFFQTGFSHRHNLSVGGGTEGITYRLSAAYTKSEAIVPGAGQEKLNLSNTLNGKLSEKISYDFTMSYTNDYVDGVFKSSGGPMIGLLRWPTGDDASNYLNIDGTRRQLSSSDGIENPYFNVNKNDYFTRINRISSVSTVYYNMTEWFSLIGKFGFDVYSNQNFILRHPESNLARTVGGMIDDAAANNRSLNYEYFANFKKQFGGLRIDLKAGSTIYDYYYKSVAGYGENFLDPNFAALNNIPPDRQRTRSIIQQRRVIGAFGVLTINYKSIFNMQLNARNDWSSTLPLENNSFIYPAANFAFLLSELPAVKQFDWLDLAKIRGAYGVARKDPPPYGVYPALESQPTTGGGYAYGFTGPNPLLKPEKTTSIEGGIEVRVFGNRLGLDATYYKRESVDQIISNLRLSYGTGYVLSVMNGGTMWSKGIELQLRGVPVRSNSFNWEILGNFNATRSKLTYLPTGLVEYYNSDTWIYGNVRNGAIVGESVSTLSGLPYLRNNNGDILINPQTGMPLRNTLFGAIGDRNPDWTLGISNNFSYKNLEFSFLLDTRRGGDVFNGTEHMLAVAGLSMSTLDRETPVIVKGVLRDGFENTANPTWNNIVVIPSRAGISYYNTTPNNGILNEEDFVERDINWIRLKDITLRYRLPASLFQSLNVKSISSLSVFITATDLFLITNYTGLDPVILGNNAAVSGTGSAGMDYGNFPLPMGFYFGFSVGF